MPVHPSLLKRLEFRQYHFDEHDTGLIGTGYRWQAMELVISSRLFLVALQLTQHDVLLKK
jgi:hypothetical protein